MSLTPETNRKRISSSPPIAECDCADCLDFWDQFEKAYLFYIKSQKEHKAKECLLVEDTTSDIEDLTDVDPTITCLDEDTQPIVEDTKLRRTDTASWDFLRRGGSVDSTVKTKGQRGNSKSKTRS